jgi:hypothetical protein
MYNKDFGVPMELLINQYTEAYLESKSASSEFPSSNQNEIEAMRRRHALNKVRLLNKDLAPLAETHVIYIGHDGLSVTRNGNELYSNMYAMQATTPPSLVRLHAKGNMAEVFKELAPYTRYKMTVGKRENANTLFIDNRFKKDQGHPVPMSVEQLNKTLGIPKVSVNNAVNNPSKTQSDGWTIDTDWRCVIGYLDRFSTFQNKRNQNIVRGVCTIIDDPNSTANITYDTEGNPIRQGLTGWTASEHLIYEKNSYCAFYGPIKVSKNDETGKKEASLNVYHIKPIFADEIQGVD